MKTLIVFYSMGGNTAHVAERLAARLGAETLRLEPEKAYPSSGFRKFFWGGKSAVMAETPKLKPYTFDDGCGRIVFGFPVWAGNITPPLRTFIKDNAEALKGKRFAAFACQSGSGGEKALAKLRECLGGTALEAEAILIDPKDKPSADNDKRIDEFCAALAR